MKLWEKLPALRREHGMTQAELAEALDVSRQTVSKWERGVAVPSADNLACMGRLFGVPLDDLMDDGVALRRKPVEVAAVAEPPRERRGLRIAGVAVLVACLLLSAVASVITIGSAIAKGPRKPDILWQQDMACGQIDLAQVEPLDGDIILQADTVGSHISSNIAGYSVSVISPQFSMEREDLVALRYVYSLVHPYGPPVGSLDFGLLDSEGRFYSVNLYMEGGSISQIIGINEAGNYMVAVRNNSAQMVCVSGFMSI